jgi:hypothetical protein
MIGSANDVEIYAPDTVELEPGRETIVDVSLRSRVDAASVQYGLVLDSLEFVNHRWEVRPVHEGIVLDQRVSNRLIIEAPKRPDCKAGVYMIWLEVNVRNGDGEPGSYRHPIEVKVNRFVEWRPKLIPNKAERPGAYIFQLTNLSNHTLQFVITGEEVIEDGFDEKDRENDRENDRESGLKGAAPVHSDRTGSCVFDIEPGKPILYPGQLGSIDVLVKVLPRRRRNPIRFKLNVDPQEPL